ncbi:hypothetical protein DMB66_03755 [Actinoplanes sp. ATCC 53533]|uniref:NB-ARC domain-containing protein n=1 Tax=Actinoplanes sp. ATCC 53533 TaxID=1288362 RepID=UPI000F777739|nr:NB-ARC domain-containing protein [Actinoplanes sp. ATCC 53533]RSM73155.1 hypothetical protein DMB66_03755 [Actinoplanes sp. ATCC 53533]
MVDVLIITALPLEYEAARSAGSAIAPGNPGVTEWRAEQAGKVSPYLLGEYVSPDGISLSVALALATRMGGRTVGPLATALAERLKPSCLAMSGVCAGDPAAVALGDVIVAEMVYDYDEGKRTKDGFLADYRPLQVHHQAIQAARAVDTATLPSFAEATETEARLWYLQTLLLGREPRDQPGRERYFPRGTWQSRLADYADAGLITRHDNEWALTERGRAGITRAIYDDVDGPDRLPFGLAIGPVAAGAAVVKDGVTWQRLRDLGVRSITGLEMESAAIATVASTQDIPLWLVAKGVVDHADPDKRDRYQRFAAKASAEVLFALLGKLAGTITGGRADGGPPVADWRTALGNRGLKIWTDELFTAGTATDDSIDPPPPLMPHQPVDAVLLRKGRLPNLQREFAGLGRAFDGWVGGRHRKRGDPGLRVLWLVGAAGAVRSKALLAAVSRARKAGHAVYDPGRNLELAATTLAELGLAELPAGPVLIPVDLPDHQPSSGWNRLLEALDAIRRQERKRDRPDPVLVVGGTAAQEQLAYGVLQSSIEIDPVDVQGNAHQRPDSYAGTESMASPSLSAEDIFNRGLPKTAPELFGREDELRTLHDAWLSDDVQILSVVAPGGVGKSALVNQWLREMRGCDYLGARKLFAWSFYSQGTRENMVSADDFVSSALQQLGDDAPPTMSPPARGARLAALIRRHRFLLVLDGLEPLQHPETAPDVGGTLTDSSMAALLRDLAKPGWDGLCLITTRVPLADLAAAGRAVPATVAELDLGNLGDRAGALLLQSLIGPQRDLTVAEEAVREVMGHALAINLLGRYLRDVQGGQLAGRFALRDLTVAVADGGHARRIMETYAEWLARYDRSAELAILEMIGLFDRPAPYAAIEAVLTETELGRSVPGLDDLGGATWVDCVASLRHMGLLGSETEGLPGTLDTHPLVREHFRDRLRSTAPELWTAGHRALYTYFQRRAPQLPSSAEGMSLLYEAVNHGCAIDQHQEVFDTVLQPRIWRDPRASYSTRTLGMTGSEIVALSNYFHPHQWTELRDIPLSRQARLMVLTNAGLRLRQIGQLNDARASCGAVFHAVDPSADQPAEMADASYTASLYCELLVIAGHLQTPGPDSPDTARASAELAIDFASRCEDPYFKMYSRSCLAEVDFMVGDLGRAGELFAEAEAISLKLGANPPFGYSQTLYRYGYYVIETGGAAGLLTDAKDPGWGLNGGNSTPLSRAIRPLVLAAAHRAQAERGALDRSRLAEVVARMDAVIVELRGVGYTDYIVRGLLERAHLLRVRQAPEDYAKALEDLDEAIIETTRGGMHLLAADVHLQRAACHLAVWPSLTPEQRNEAAARAARALAEAARRVRSLGYGRRYPMLADLERQARDQGVAATATTGRGKTSGWSGS